MAKKPPITNVTSGFSSTIALNNNFTSLRDGFDNTLSLDGSTPNALQTELDLANNNIINAGSVETDTLFLGGVLMTPSGVDPVYSGTISSFGASQIDDVNAAAGRTTLGLGTASSAAVTDFVSVSGDSMTGNLSLGDNDKVIFGTGSDLQIYHNPNNNNSIISEQGTGNLVIGANDLFLKNTAGTQTYAQFDNGGSSFLYNNNNLRLTTTSTGIDVTGTVNATSYTGDGSNLTGVGSSTTLGAVGTYAFLRTGTGVSIIAGTSYSGSNLVYAGASTGTINSGTTLRAGTNPTTPTLSGTWRAMSGHTIYASNYSSLGLFVRIS